MSSPVIAFFFATFLAFLVFSSFLRLSLLGFSPFALSFFGANFFDQNAQLLNTLVLLGAFSLSL